MPIENTELSLQALAYVHKVCAELMADHAAPGLGTQNQAVYFILNNPELRSAVAKWAATINIEEASARPPQRLAHDELYRRTQEYLEKINATIGTEDREAAALACDSQFRQND